MIIDTWYVPSRNLRNIKKNSINNSKPRPPDQIRVDSQYFDIPFGSLILNKYKL